jgi:hypothetical protein
MTDPVSIAEGTLTASPPGATSAVAGTRRGAGQTKRAVLVIHGMGNQSPMQTLRGFVDALWTNDPSLTSRGKRQTWSKPDTLSGNRELRRITTSADKSGVHTDFFEFYWAHMMEDTQLSSVVWWLKRLFLRPLSRVPPEVAAAWWGGWMAIIALLGVIGVFSWLVLLTLRHLSGPWFAMVAPLVAAGAIALFLWILRHRVLVEVVGDAARYLTAAPQNIGARSEIRAAGLELLRDLHASPEYDRIVLACHSLGSVIGYDLVRLFWAEKNEGIAFEDHEAKETLAAIEDAAFALVAGREGPTDLGSFRDAQRHFSRSLCAASAGRWKITDFVTLGCPLTHAHFLAVDDREEALRSEADRVAASWLAAWAGKLRPATRRVAELFLARVAQREFPLCPPLCEHGKRFSYEDRSGRVRMMHHAAPFAAVRWTNIFAPRRFILWGDVVGGPVAPLFGPGVKDVALTGAAARSFIAHVKYWMQGFRDREHIEALRAAVNLLDEDEASAWERLEREKARMTAG